MYKLIIDTSSLDLNIILIKNNSVHDEIIIKDIVKKADILASKVKEILYRNNLHISQISNFLITNGPGSFTGSRISITFVRPIALINNAKIFVTSTNDFYCKYNYSGKIFIDAKSNLSFVQEFLNGKKSSEIKLLKSIANDKLDINDLRNNTSFYINKFKEINPSDISVNYIKKTAGDF